MVVIRVTLDTNVLIGGLDGKEEEQEIYRRLVSWHEQQTIEIAISNRIEKDKETDKDRAKSYKHLLEATRFTEISSPFRVGVSQDHGIMGDESVLQCLHKIRDVDYATTSLNTLWDIDHLYGHFISHRDWFLTNEGKIWKKRPFLSRIRINVSTPAVFTKAVETLITKKDLSSEALSQEIERTHPGKVDKNYAKMINSIIDEFLAIEQKELEEAKFRADAHDPTTGVGMAINIICNRLFESGLAHNRENAVLMATKIYTKLLADYQSEGSVYGSNDTGFAQWTKELYDQKWEI